ncbi:MAG: glycoside hydrolase family 2 TIM barrel-domain containing protein [Chthoniobacterales bacterium]
MNSLSLKSIVTAAAFIVTTGIAAAANITEIKTYQSTISTDAGGPLDLKMEANYNNAVSNAPLMVMLHQYSGPSGLFDQVRPNAQQVRDQGFFVVTVAMRGREGSGGVRDSGGLEIYDILDAVEAAKTQYGSLINPNNINITGYSGGGGNTMSALTKFPDLFRTGGAFYGMSDYGYDLVNGWYNNGAASNHKTQLDTDVGNPNGATALITSRYMARASNLASRNNPYSEIHFFVNGDEPTCPPINDTSYRNNAIAAASFTGEFNNITLHTGNAGTYQDFNGNGINDASEQQYWPHTTLTTDQQASGLSWYLSRVLNGSIAAPVLNASDNLFVAGFVRTKKFSFFVGDGQNGAGSLLYSLTPGVKTFTFHLQSTYAVTGKLTVDTADMNGQTVNVVRNGVVTATFTGGGTYQVTGIADNETVRLVAPSVATTNEVQYLSGTDKDNTVPWDFRVSAGRNAGVWTTIPVPSCWETKGFGTYEYGNINTTEYGEYKKTFNVPANWAGKRIFLVYEGSMTDTETRINGAAPGGGTVSTPTPLANDRAFNNAASTSMGQGGGIAASATGNVNLGTLTSFTLACWIKPEADFSTIPDGRFPRLMLIGATANYDANGNGVYLAAYNSGGNTRTLQFKVNTDSGNGVIATPNVLSGSDWTFVAVTYDSTLGSNQVKIYVGNRSGALGTPVTTATYGAGASVPFGANAFAYFLNRGDRGRAFDGSGDDFRIFNGALSQAQLESVRASGLGASATPPTPLYQWNLNTASSGTTVAPVTGAGGTLTLQNSGGTATDLYSAIGSGVSAGQAATSTSALHQGSFYEFSYDVTNNLNYGASNLLEATVKKVSANASVNDAERTADYWVFGGIHRPVYLEARPPANIERVAVDAKANGQISVSSFLSGVTSPCTVAARVTDMNNNPLGAEFTQAAATGTTSVVLSATLPTPQPWSPEFPNLYKLTIELRDGAAVLNSRTETIGFRTIGFVANSGFTLNGKKIVMRGANRHEIWPTDGRTTSRAVSIADIELMKSLNMNAVRMSHYPPSKHFLEECDRLGLLVLDELAGWQGAYDNIIGPGLVREMVIRDVNHPSIFAWANGNEGGSNGTLDDDFGLWDPQNRKVLHPANWPTELTGGVRTHHYAPYDTFISYLGAGQPVFMPTEMQHALFDGGGGAGLADHWNAMRTAPNGGGMFIWSLIDEGIVRDDQGGAVSVSGADAADGIVGPYREKEASYYSVKALWSPVQITAPNPATFTGSLAVENRFDFTNLNQCTFSWKLGWFPDPTDSTAVQNSGFIVGKSSVEFAGPSVASGASGTLTLGVPASVASYDALRVTAKDTFGREIYTWTWPLHSVAQVHNRIVNVAGTPSGLTPSVNGSVLSITNGTRTWAFDLSTGRLNGVTVSGQPVSLSNGPRPVSGSWTTSSVTHGFDGADYVVTMNDVTSASNGFQWRIHPNGWVNLKYRYTLTGTQTWLGVTFDYPEANVTGMRWLGQGPYRVWKNRLEGQEIGVNYKAANNIVNGTQWGYPEFRGYHGQLYWAQLGTTQQPITLTTDTSNLFLRVLTPSLTPSNYTWITSVSPTFPAGNLSLLHAINAIGNKFQSPAATTIGPSSADTTATGLYEGGADFYFGALPEPGVDRDGNGLGDSWELQQFNTLGQDPNADPDGDGMTNAQEFAAGTNPNDSSSSLKITQIQASGNDFVLSFPSVSGKTYRAERSDTLQGGSWTTVQTNGVPQDNIAGNGGTKQVTDTGGGAQGKRFYRVVSW